MAEKVEKIKTLNESIIQIRVDLQNSTVKKSGKNDFAKFEYFELADFLPKLNELMLREGINDRFSIEDGKATLELIKGEEKQSYTIPFIMFDVPLTKEGKMSMQEIQYLGAENTYYKRYLYLNAFGITDGEVIDKMDNTKIVKGKKAETNKVTEPSKEVDYKKLLVDKLKELGLDMAQYFKENKLNSQTTQEEAKRLYETLSKVEKGSDK